MTNDPDTLPYLALRSEATPAEGGFNSGYYANPEVDRLLEQARRATDRAERARLYREMQAIVHADAPWAFVASWQQNAVARTEVENFDLQPSFLLHLAEVEKRHILRVVEALGGNRSRAADVLRIDRKTLYRKLDRWSREQDEG
jgi:peptide/nickel transport system substrate-binding protein